MSKHKAPPTPDAALLQGTLDMLILKVVALEPIHGYAIAQRLQQMSRDALLIRHGSLYPALYRLEEKGLAAEQLAAQRRRTGRQVLRPLESRSPPVEGGAG